MDWSSILEYGLETTISLVIGAFVPKIVSFMKDIRLHNNKTQQTMEQISKSIADLTQSFNNLQQQFQEYSEKSDKQLKLLSRGQVGLTRNYLIQECEKLITRGKATYDEKSKIHETYETYDALVVSSGSSNGVMEDYIEAVDALPLAESAA